MNNITKALIAINIANFILLTKNLFSLCKHISNRYELTKKLEAINNRIKKNPNDLSILNIARFKDEDKNGALGPAIGINNAVNKINKLFFIAWSAYNRLDF